MRRAKVQKGFNSDILYKGLTYHVQTEDWGAQNPFFVSQIFRNGAVVKNIKIPYTKVLPAGQNPNVQAVRFALEMQHQSILDLLVSGQLF
ncbi:MAG: hypothetical protein KDD38_02180 [Bdellovibrionales bacterium]|nr:hypothetical protein [Bdellovibrionales bacterium]